MRLLPPNPGRWANAGAAMAVLLMGCASTTPAEQKWPDGVGYEIFVQSFADSDGDGVGDLRGLTERLGYVDSLGARAIWLMPIHPSPSYHKYDVVDYRAVHADYGTLDDFKAMVRAAHERGIAVIIDLVVNHTGRDHPWFLQAAADPSSPFRDYYVWAPRDSVAGEEKEAAADSDNRRAWHEAPGSDGDGEVYYAYFGGHMPDLNFDNPSVRREIIDAGRFWLEEVGVDGFRLDAAKHIFPDDRAADNHAWWVEFRQAMQAVRPDVYLVGEVWDRADVVAPYLKGLTALFNFDLGYAVTAAVREGRADSLVYRLSRIRDFYTSVDPRFRDAIFLTNHDQNRIMSALEGDARKARVAAALLLTLPGSPFVYYGEELGMLGRKPDEHIREPFRWGGAAAARETRWITPRYSTPAAVASAAEQSADPASLLNHYRRLIALRNASPALTNGDLVPVDPGAGEALVSYLRTYAGDTLWVVHNLSGAALDVPVPPALRGLDHVLYPAGDGVVREPGRLTLPPHASAVFSAR